ncbi:MAG: hypothetical protein WKG07_27870, partial [Hymenobacter sp.]
AVLLNIYGFLNFSREVPDGKDVNCSFPARCAARWPSWVAHRAPRPAKSFSSTTALISTPAARPGPTTRKCAAN